MSLIKSHKGSKIHRFTAGETHYFRKKYNRQDKTFPEIRIYELASLPIKKVGKSNQHIKAEIEKLVAQLIQLNEETSEIKLATKLDQLLNKIDYCENRINQLVYQLYDLTEEEIKSIES